MSAIEWAFVEVVGTEHTFNQTTGAELKKKRDKDGKAVGEDLADPKYRGEIEVTMQANQGGIPGGLSGDTITDTSVAFYKIQANISIEIGHGTTATYDFSQGFYDLELSQASTNSKILRGKVNLIRELM